MERHRVGIVIPALNEAATVSEIVSAAYQYGVPIVVDDGSTDGTANLAAGAGALVIVHKGNLGYDAALNSGFVEASKIGFDVIVTLDADGQHSPNLLERFIAGIEDGHDVVIGVRSRRQRVAEHVFAWYTKWRYGIRDPLCGMKAYHSSVFRDLGHFDSYGSVGTELAIYAARSGYRIGQEYFIVRARADKPRFGKVLYANYRIFRAMFLSLLT